MSSAFRRKTYGKVRPVPKLKPKAPVKPSVNELKSIFRNMQKAPTRQWNDYLSKGLLWWTAAQPYISFKLQGKIRSVECARAYLRAESERANGHKATTEEAKQAHFVNALVSYARYAVGIVKVPDVRPYLKQKKELVKKEKIKTKRLAERFDPILSLLEKCFSDENGYFEVSLKAVEHTGIAQDVRYEHSLGTVFYRRDRLLEIKKRLYKQGLLAVVLGEVEVIARLLAIKANKKDTQQGMFIPDIENVHLYILQLLNRFERFARTLDAPRSLVKREKKKKVSK